MAGALLGRQLSRLRVPSTVRTGGTHSSGQPAMDRAVRLLAAEGLDVEGHRSRVVDDELMAASDIIVTAERDHVVWISGRWPGAFAKTFTLPELVARAERSGARGGTPIAPWLQRIGEARPMAFDYLDARTIAEVADPTGKSPAVWDAAFAEIDDLTRRLAKVLGLMGVKQIVKRISLVADHVAKPPAGVTVLIYHRIGGGSASAVDIDSSVFDEHLAHLAEHHRVLSLGDALAELAVPTGFGTENTRHGVGDPAVVITFDDGTSDFTEHAVPALVRHGVPATLYAATRFIEEQEEFPWGAPPASWGALRDAVDTGLVSIGSHTHSHWLLDRADAQTVADDLDRSIELIGEHIGTAPLDFAYPKALPGSPAAEIAVRRRFRSAGLAASRVNRPGHTDAHRLWRTPVQDGDDRSYFAAKASGGLRLEGELRSLAARVRYRGASR